MVAALSGRAGQGARCRGNAAECRADRVFRPVRKQLALCGLGLEVKREENAWITWAGQ